MTPEILDDAEEEDENLSEADYSRKSEFSKARVVEDAIRKCQEMRSQEMREGYWNFINLPNGDTKRVYVPDTRKAFIGSVESLKGILAPEIKLDDLIEKGLKEFEEKKEKTFEECAVPRRYIEGTIVKEMKDKKYIPEIDEEIPITMISHKNGLPSSSFISRERGYWNYNVREFWNQMVENYDYLFAELNLLVSRPKINYFKQKSGY